VLRDLQGVRRPLQLSLWNCKLLKLTTPWSFNSLHVFNCIIWKTQRQTLWAHCAKPKCMCIGVKSLGQHQQDPKLPHFQALTTRQLLKGKYHSSYYKSSFNKCLSNDSINFMMPCWKKKILEYSKLFLIFLVLWKNWIFLKFSTLLQNNIN